MDMQESLELKMMGLELSEELWRKKWEEQVKKIGEERERLEIKEREIEKKETVLTGGKKRGGSVAGSSNKGKKIRVAGSGMGRRRQVASSVLSFASNHI